MRKVILLLVVIHTLSWTRTNSHTLQSSRQTSVHRHHKIKHRQLEDELVQGAEESIELFEFPRVHDTSEQIHEHTAQQNLTANSILTTVEDKNRAHRGMQRLPIENGEGTFSYNREREATGLYRQSDGMGQSEEAGYAIADRQIASGDYRMRGSK
ncbi:cellular morphogenesis protein [Pseudozyma hubeiensis SY62]|uniref:Cellular morphogenesis protein n=1 Tax=Pseudozyma hubeiensis (strain SY62) TaxID=1305764 RepID=R9P007_PSEHS|nr:cellular morphogenesis protein [Pseudozyma hubeiensis SY62]GAC94436.1 cellular morphogenesis protein [Pseudozyma hubeiensis SY62]